MKRNVKKLIADVDVDKMYGKDEIDASGVCHDSRIIEKEQIFVAVKGLTVDGHDYIDSVIKKGAIAIVGELEPKKKWVDSATYIKVSDSRKALGKISANWFDNPSKKMHVIGVTGTDGKTTTASMIYHILKNAGKRVGLLTTVSAKIENEEIDTGYHVTSPDPIDLQRILAEMVERHLNYAVVEVTSHGLTQGRVAGTDFETAVMTNITHEHLDYHKTAKDYFESKLNLFLMARNFVILNANDPNSQKIKSELADETDTIMYGTRNGVEVEGQDYRKRGKYFLFNVLYKGEITQVKLRIPGEFNMENALAAISTGIAYGITPENSSKYFLSFTGVKGRMQEIKNKKGLKIYIDFAHTPNSLERTLKFLKKQKKGKLISVFGCAGERDKEKRILMPKASIKYADISIFTAEDPRNENIEDILNVMKKAAKSVGGMKFVKAGKENKNAFLEIPERGEAISYAINELAESGDTVAILGKGHEKSMAYSDEEYPWSDFDAVEMALKGKIKKVDRE